MLLLLTFCVFPTVSQIIFQTYNCDANFDDGAYLRLDYTIDCDTSIHRFFLFYATIMIFVYPVGVPLFYFVNLYFAGVKFRASDARAGRRLCEKGTTSARSSTRRRRGTP